MKKLFWAVLSGLFIVVLNTAAPATQSAPSAVYASSSDKVDEDCTGHETVGHCADKCANPGDTLLGYDATTGAAICKSPDQTNTAITPSQLPTDLTPPTNTEFTGK